MLKPSLVTIKVLALLALSAALQTWLLYLKAEIYMEPGTDAVVFSVFALLMASNAVAVGLLRLVARRRSLPWLLTVSSGTITIVTAIATYYYFLFNEHLNGENFALAIDGLMHGEAGVGYVAAAKFCLSIVLIYVFSALVTLAVWRPARDGHGSTNATQLASVLVALNVVGAGWRATVPLTDLSYDAQTYIPWVHFLPEKISPPLVSLSPPIERGGYFELEDLKQLTHIKQRILSGNITAERRPNVLFVHLESLRSDRFTPENMPELYKESSNSLQSLPMHFTTGPNTGTGLHGLINGLPASYYQFARYVWFRPITLSVLKKLGYRNSVYATRGLEYEQLGDLFFNETMDTLTLVSDGEIADREQRMVTRYIDDLKKDGDQPRFDYMMFYSTHFDYFFPETFSKYQPVQKLGFDINNGRQRDNEGMREGLFNRYRNATLFVDHLVSEIVQYLKDSDRLKNTVVIITGDHGEEFWEHGKFGHIFGLVNEQIRVPALVHFPKPLPPGYQITSHQDFMPTLFDFMNVHTSGTTCGFMTGRSLYRHEGDNDYALASLGVIQKNLKFTEMLIGKGYKIRFDYKDELRVVGVFDYEDHPLDDFDRPVVADLVRHAVETRRHAFAQCDGSA